MSNDRCLETTSGKVFISLLAILALFSLVLSFTLPLADNDTWWHLATGRYLVQTESFLSADPFGLAGVQVSPGREMILNGYWLSQLLFYSLYQFFGLVGIISLRVVLLLIAPIAALAYGWRRFPFSPAVLFLALLSGWGMIEVAGIRPNHLTVAFVPLLFILLAEVGYAAEWQAGDEYNLCKAWLIPLLTLIWANTHGGFLLGVAVLILYVVGETITVLWRKRLPRSLVGLWVVAVATVLASLLTPNGVQPYIQYLAFQGGVIQQKTYEYMSPLVMAKNGVLFYWPYFIVLILCLVVGGVYRFKIPGTRLLLLLFLAGLSLTAFRYAPLFIGAAIILLISDIGHISEVPPIRGRLLAGCNIILVAALLFSALLSVQQKIDALSKSFIDESRFPAAAVDFLTRKGISGVVFNHFNWGGYIAWRQPQKLLTFVDSRSMSLPLFHEYTRVLWLPEEMQSILDRRGVDLIVMPRLNPYTGELYALTDFLGQNKTWELVYHDSIGMVLVRQGLFPAVERLNKGLIYRDVLQDLSSVDSSHFGASELKQIENFAKMRLRLASGLP